MSDWNKYLPGEYFYNLYLGDYFWWLLNFPPLKSFDFSVIDYTINKSNKTNASINNQCLFCVAKIGAHPCQNVNVSRLVKICRSRV